MDRGPARLTGWIAIVLLVSSSLVMAQESPPVSENARPTITEAANGTADRPETDANDPTIGQTDRQSLNQEVDKMVARGIAFLRNEQAEDGGYDSPADPGATALITTAMIRSGVQATDPLVAKSLAYLQKFVQPDGGVYRKDTYYRNYETCLAIMCFSQANSSGEYSPIIDDALKFVKQLQWGGAGDETSPDDPAFGGAGYGKHGRPDLSNTQYLLDALKAAGSSENFESVQRALKFVSRCQNLKSEHNDTKFAARENDGGFYYTPAAGGSSQAGNSPTGGLRSYGSMTYAGLKSMLYAGLTANDVRVTAAVDWIRQHYDLTQNPGMGAAGLYYYYHTLAKALSALGEQEFVDQAGTAHDWRSELAQTLKKRQRPDGSWRNDQDRWYEGDTKLVTGYALLTLDYCLRDR